MERLFQIAINKARFGIISKHGIVIDAAPIGSWMVGKRLTDIKPWLLRVKAKVVEVEIKSH
jgi:hypothetical protein